MQKWIYFFPLHMYIFVSNIVRLFYTVQIYLNNNYPFTGPTAYIINVFQVYITDFHSWFMNSKMPTSTGIVCTCKLAGYIVIHLTLLIYFSPFSQQVHKFCNFHCSIINLLCYTDANLFLHGRARLNFTVQRYSPQHHCIKPLS